MVNQFRITALNNSHVFIQIKDGGEWVQVKFNYGEFEKFMQDERPSCYAEYLKSGTEKNPAEWFYHYGKSLEMIMKGEAFIF